MLKTYILLWMACIITIYPQSIYYQQKFITYIDGEPVTVKFNNLDYNIYKGSVSPDGRYLAGIIINDNIKDYIDNVLMVPGIVDFFKFEDIKLIVYSFEDKSILFHKAFNYEPSYSLTDKHLFIEDSRSISIYDLTRTDYPIKVDAESSNFIINKDTIYNLIPGKDELLLKIFNYNTGTFELLNKFPNVPGNSYYEGVYNNIPVVKTITDSCTVLTILSKEQKKYYFYSYSSLFTNDKLYVTGNENYYNLQFHYLYAYNSVNNKFDKLFSIPLLANDYDFYQLLIVSADNENFYYFISQNLDEEENNLLKYNSLTNDIERITKEGYISLPAGIIKKRAD